MNILAYSFFIVVPAKDDILEGLRNASEVENFIGAISKIILIGPYFSFQSPVRSQKACKFIWTAWNSSRQVLGW